MRLFSGSLKGIILSILIFFLENASLRGEIMSAQTMKDVCILIEKYLSHEKQENIFVFFDIDMTLTQPVHPAVTFPAIKKYEDIFKRLTKPLTPVQKDYIFTLITQKFLQKLVDPRTPYLLQNLQKKGIKVMAFTSSLVNISEDSSQKTIVKRQKDLEAQGLNFEASLGKMGDSFVFSFPEYAAEKPMFHRGILSTNGENNELGKGKVLGAFLEGLCKGQKSLEDSSCFPALIILVDDRDKNLLDVENFLHTNFPMIRYIGILYEGAFKESFQ